MPSSGIAFRTRFGGTPPLRAISTPQCMWSSSRIECASGLMLIMQPKSKAAWCHRQSRSSLQGWALISTATSCFAQARSTFSMSISYPGAALELASRHVSDDRRMAIGDCSQKPVGLRFPIELEAAVDAGDHEIEPVEDIVWIVQGAVGQDVGFDSLQNPECLAELPVEPVGLAVLLLDLLEREPARVVCRLGMVRHSEILKAALSRGVRHRLERLCAIGRVGVTVQDSAQIAVGDELGQFAR